MNLVLTVTLGDVLTVAAFIGTGIGLWLRISTRLTRIETMLEPLWDDWLKKR